MSQTLERNRLNKDGKLTGNEEKPCPHCAWRGKARRLPRHLQNVHQIISVGSDEEVSDEE